MNPAKHITTSFIETQELGKAFAQELHGGEVLLLQGDLGSGKTTFVQGLAQGLGISSRIISPTFIIMRKYEVKKQGINAFYHVDLYRVENKRDIQGVGLVELLGDPQTVVVIEWPEKLGELSPKNAKKLSFHYLGDDKREITVY